MEQEILPITPELIARIERFHIQFNYARMLALQALPHNPYQVEVRQFGQAWAFKSLSPLLRGKNRIGNFGATDILLLEEILTYFRRDGLRCTLQVPYGGSTPDLFQALSRQGLWSAGSGTVPFLTPPTTPVLPQSVSLNIRESLLSEKNLYLKLFRESFAHRGEGDADYLMFQWAEDTLPGSFRYLAEINHVPVGMASFIVMDGVGFFGTAGVHPAWRNRGIQTALMCHLIAQARSLGCDLIVGGGSVFSTTHRNMERLGMRLSPTGTSWQELPV